MRRRGSTRTKAFGGAVGGSALAAMALALGAPGSAAAAPGPTVSTLSPSVQAAPAAAPVPASVGSVPIVGQIVAPPSVSSQPAAAPAPGSGSVKTQASGATISVTPNSNLTDGQKVVVKGSGFAKSSAGGMAECNNAPNQPTEQVYGNAVPVGCTNPLNTLQATDSNGDVNAAGAQNFTIHTGTIGPPVSGQKDSAGNDGAADAAKYPCPPTPAQQQQGITCGISYGDASGNQASADVTFAATGGGASTSNNATASPTSTPGWPSGGGGGAGSTAAAGGSGGSGSASGPTNGSTDSSGGAAGGSLPFTGFGVGMWRLTLLGGLLSGLGVGLILLGHRPGALVRRVWRLRPALVQPFGIVSRRLRQRWDVLTSH